MASGIRATTRRRISVRCSPIHGNGVFALAQIARGELIWLF
jgi:SET domain-containing protein